MREWGPGPFTTHAVLQRPDGTELEWSSRRHRKRLGMLRDPTSARSSERYLDRGGDSEHSDPHASAMSWWLGALFMTGAFCFALGSFPPYFNAVSAGVDAVTFFIGSIPFTTAAFLQYYESSSAPRGVTGHPEPTAGWRALIGTRGRQIDWWACVVQFGGTIFFNVSTFAATRTDFTAQQARRLVWAPDVFGCICFLIASWLAYSEVCRRAWWRPERDLGWRISALNMVGSIAFAASAIGARYVSDTTDVTNIALVNLGTFIGGACFFVGAALLPVESRRDRTSI